MDVVSNMIKKETEKAVKGYDVSVVEYVSPLDTPKNIMIKAEKKSGENMDKVMDFYNLCGELGVELSIGK